MAQAGTPTVQANQPATSSFNGLWQALLAMIAVLALGAAVIVVSNIAAANRASAVPTVDHRLDTIEGQKGAISFAGPKADRRFDELMLADSSYNAVEQSRGAALAGTARALNGTGPTSVSGTDPAAVDSFGAQRGPSTAAAAQILVKVQPQVGPSTAAAAQILVSGTAPDNGSGRIQGHRGAQIGQ
jgi:hypothetical protein